MSDHQNRELLARQHYIDQLERENAALRKDKDRLDSGMIRLRAFSEWGNGWCVHSGIDLRAAIDAARREEGKP